MSNRNMANAGAQQEPDVNPDYSVEYAKPLPKGAKSVEHGEAVAPKKSRSQAASHLGHAARIHEEFGKPLAFFGEHFWALDREQGWIVVTPEVHRVATKAQKRDGSRTIVPVLQTYLRVPDYGSNHNNTLYWERIGGWEGHWKPLFLAQHQVLFADGIYDCVEDSFEPTTGRAIFGPRLSQAYLNELDEEPVCEEFEMMVRRMFPDPEVRRHFQEVAGLVLSPHHLLRGQVILVGEPRSGKTTLATAIGCAPCGPRGMGNTQEYALVKDKWARTDLLGKFINVSDDSPVVAGWPGFAKSYTSGKFRMEFKYQTPITTLGTAKLWSTCNEMQDSADASGAMSDRLFPFRVTGIIDARGERTEYMTDTYWNDPDKRMGVVAWMLAGLVRYWGRGGRFDAPVAWEAEKLEAVGQGDPLEGWLRDNIEVGTGEIDKRALEEKMPTEILPRHHSPKVGVYMARLFGSSAFRTERNGERVRVYSGVTWK